MLEFIDPSHVGCRPPPLRMYVWGGGTPRFLIHFYRVPKMVLGNTAHTFLRGSRG